MVLAGRETDALGLEAEEFDLLLMDVQMPELDGLQATAALQKREKVTGPRHTIVALTTL